MKIKYVRNEKSLRQRKWQTDRKSERENNRLRGRQTSADKQRETDRDRQINRQTGRLEKARTNKYHSSHKKLRNSAYHTDYMQVKRNMRNSVLTEFCGHPTVHLVAKFFLFFMKQYENNEEIKHIPTESNFSKCLWNISVFCSFFQKCISGLADFLDL